MDFPRAVRARAGPLSRACSRDTCHRRSPPRCSANRAPLLTDHQADTVDALKAQCPGFTTMRRLTLSFRATLRGGKVATLHRWLVRAHATNIDALQRFVRTLRRDLSAVEGAVREPWS